MSSLNMSLLPDVSLGVDNVQREIEGISRRRSLYMGNGQSHITYESSPLSVSG
ncbi:hypothetical protein RJ641_001764, partial [Dillenia turbinata]